MTKIKLINNAPMNEPMGSTNSGAEGNSIITIIAAKLAPLVIPITSGDARISNYPLNQRQKWPNYFPQLNLVTFSEFGTRLI